MIQPDDGVVYSAWDGQVEFVIEPYVNMFSLITLDQIKSAVPEHADFENVARLAFNDFGEFMASTIDIRFNLKDDAPPMLRRLEAFWTGRTRNWAEDWQTFIRMNNADIRQEWWNALNNVSNPAAAAPPELATPLPDLDVLEGIPDDAPLSENGRPLNGASSKSSLRKRKVSKVGVQ